MLWQQNHCGAHLEALRGASIAGRLGVGGRAAAEAARRAPSPQGPPRAVDLLLEGLAVRFTDGYAASAPTLKRALREVRDQGGRAGQDVRWPWTARRVAPDLFDDDAWHELGTRNVQIARDAGALAVLPLALNYLATMRTFEGNLEAATALLEEADVIADATGAGPIVFGRLQLAAFRGDEAQASVLFEASEPVAGAASRTTSEPPGCLPARRELIATGETVRKRTVETSDQLTAQETLIARLARDGLSNPEIAAQLFLSARTVEWHMRRIFTKLGIGSRRELRQALSAVPHGPRA